VRKILQCTVYFPKQPSQITKQFASVGPYLGEHPSGQKAQQPNKALFSIGQSNSRERFPLRGRLDPWQNDSGRALRQVPQSLTLQVKESALPARVHNFQNKCAAVRGFKVKIVVVLARQRSRANFQPVDISS
jgi:hypothetical protein